jgi:hypothetical protein
MNTQRDTRNAHNRRPYEPPRLRTIELVAEEVLGAGCKVYGGSEMQAVGDIYCGYGTSPCVEDGS